METPIAAVMLAKSASDEVVLVSFVGGVASHPAFATCTTLKQFDRAVLDHINGAALSYSVWRFLCTAYDWAVEDSDTVTLSCVTIYDSGRKYVHSVKMQKPDAAGLEKDRAEFERLFAESQ